MKQSELDRELRHVAKAAAKQRGWKSVNGMPYWTIGPLLFVLRMTPRVKERAFHTSLGVKWFALDRLLWEVLDIPDNINEPFSHHVNGAFVLSAAEIQETRLNELDWHPGRLEQEVEAAADSAARRALDVAGEITSLQAYLDFLQRNHDAIHRLRPHAPVNAWKEKLLVALQQDDFDAASNIARARIAADDCGGFISSGLSFYEHALQLCDRRRAASPVIH